MAMGHNLCLHFGADEHPCTTYFYVYHGYRVCSVVSCPSGPGDEAWTQRESKLCGIKPPSGCGKTPKSQCSARGLQIIRSGSCFQFCTSKSEDLYMLQMHFLIETVFHELAVKIELFWRAPE